MDYGLWVQDGEWQSESEVAVAVLIGSCVTAIQEGRIVNIRMIGSVGYGWIGSCWASEGRLKICAGGGEGGSSYRYLVALEM